jgi:hypothetical protein
LKHYRKGNQFEKQFAADSILSSYRMCYTLQKKKPVNRYRYQLASVWAAESKSILLQKSATGKTGCLKSGQNCRTPAYLYQE